MKREIIYANQFKKDMKLARRRHLPEEELHILNLLRTGTHSDLFKKYFNDTPSCSNVRGFVVYRRFLYYPKSA